MIITTIPIGAEMQNWLFGLTLIAFLIKSPTFPFHIWLPLAHAEGNTITSVILAAIL